MKKSLSLLMLASALTLSAQHVHEMKADTTAMPMEHMMHMETMSHALSRSLPMARNGSGTGWLPDASPVSGLMFHRSDWMFMLHGNLFVRYNDQDFSHSGQRGGHEFDAPDWIMLMGQRNSGEKGLLHFSTMLSFDAATGGNDGYPLLFQSGEAYRGKPLVDRQHPHDLFSELSVSYAYALDEKTDAFVYLAYPGEPALGSTAFMHRPSAQYNPDAPLSHHWIDATHITFGVATAGFRVGRFKVEGSSFTGREPNAHRYDFDKPRFDSYSGRLSFNPDEHWSFQISRAYLKSPEELHPEENVTRTTASATLSVPLRNDSSFDTVLLWGNNRAAGHGNEDAAVFESSLKLRRLAVYGKFEYVEKSSEELSLEQIAGHGPLFPVKAFTLGTSYDVLRIERLNVSAGGQLTFYDAPRNLENVYGQNPMAFEVYLRFYPGLMKM